MKLPDDILGHLRKVVGQPDLSGSDYQLIDRLGSGGMGAVFAVYDRRLKREVALKVLVINENDQKRRQRLLMEAQIIAGLEHPGVIPIHETGELADGSLYYTMKRVHGQTLTQYLEKPAQLNHLLDIFRKICDAVAFAHSRGVIHRDLKPDNIMIAEFGEVLVLDWGIARNQQPEENDLPAPPGAGIANQQATQAGVVMGTPQYMAPEQAAGQIENIDHRSDIYALGRILLELLKHLQTQDESAGLSAAERRRLVAIAGCATEEQRGDRYQSVADLKKDIDSFEAGQAIEAYRETTLESIIRWSGKHRFLILLILGYLIIRYLLFFFSRL